MLTSARLAPPPGLIRYVVFRSSEVDSASSNPGDDLTHASMSDFGALKWQRNVRLNSPPSVVIVSSRVEVGKGASRPHFNIASVASFLCSAVISVRDPDLLHATRVNDARIEKTLIEIVT